MSLEKLTGLQIKILRNAINSAFVNVASLDLFLKEELDKPALEDFTRGDNRDERTFSLILVAQAEGWTADLVEKLQLYRPNNVLVRNLPDALRLGEAAKNAVSPNDQMSLERIVRNSGYVDVRLWAEKMSEIGEATCRIEVKLDNGTAYGTGLLVGDDLVLTNYHVVEDYIVGRKDPSGIACRFDYAMDVQGLEQGQLVALAAGRDWLAAFSKYDVADLSGSGVVVADNLDFALLRLSRPMAQEEMGSGLRRARIAISTPPPPMPEPEEPVFIVQHPAGKPMALSIGKVLGLDSSGARLRYDADTEGGSSGSGVFDQKLRLVALHHAGDPKAKTRATYNQGIPIGKIAQVLVGKVDLSPRVLDQKVNIKSFREIKPDPGSTSFGQSTSDHAPVKPAEVDLVTERKVDPIAVSTSDRPRTKWALPGRLWVGLIGLIILSSAVATMEFQPSLMERVFGRGSIDWATVSTMEIHRDVAIRAAPSDSEPKLARELHPGDIEDFGKDPPAQKATINHKQWYRISLRNLDSDVYLAETDTVGSLVEWVKVSGCLRAMGPQTKTFRATLNDPAVDTYPVGVIAMTELQAATVVDVKWFRFRNNDSKLRYVRGADVEKLDPANCPS